ncbi:hypothetical protein EC01304_5599, partial [Escherichia coli 0.1304]
MNIGS